MTDRAQVFLYGTLLDPDLFGIVSGVTYDPTPTRLPGHRVVWAKDQSFPLIVEDPASEARGVLVSIGAAAKARMDFYEIGFGYTLANHEVFLNGASREAEVYHPPVATWDEGAPWSLSDWQKTHGAISREAAREYMRLFDTHEPQQAAKSFAQIRSRAASRLRAEAEAPQTDLTPAMAGQAVQVHRSTQPYTNYFAVREDDLTFPTFAGARSPLVRRAAFMGGDAVTVLPYDPITDSVQMVRQFRYGAFVRADPDPWTLEPVAGRIDAGETPEQAARREVHEETGLTVNQLHKVSAYYPSPAAYSEFLFTFVATADLSGVDGRVAGLDGEAEDIMSHVVPLDKALWMIESGAVDTGPLVISLLWLQANKTRFQQG